MSLVWLFKEHRDLYEKYLELEQRFHLEIDTYEHTIKDLEEQLAKKPALDIPALIEELFQDKPYDGGKIPDSVWLTPGQPDRDVR